MVIVRVAGTPLSSSPFACKNQPIFSCVPQLHKISATAPSSSSRTTTRRRALSVFVLTTSFSGLIQQLSVDISATSWSKPTGQNFVELSNSGGVKALDLRLGDGAIPVDGDKVAIHYYGRLAAKQGWRFDSTYDHKDATGEPIPFEFILGSGKVISGIETAVRSMKVGGIRRIIIPPSEGYQSTSQEPIPPNAEALYHHFQSNSSCQWRRINIGDAYIRYRVGQLKRLKFRFLQLQFSAEVSTTSFLSRNLTTR